MMPGDGSAFCAAPVSRVTPRLRRRLYASAGRGLSYVSSSFRLRGLRVLAGARFFFAAQRASRFRWAGPLPGGRAGILKGVEEGYWLNRGRGKVEGVK